MDLDILEWLNLALRWTHIFAGILWVGTTFFFTWLDGRFAEMSDGKNTSTEKNVYMVHSGGFYVVEKQKTPHVMPEKLHWFRWEAAVTWLSGMLLLFYLYYVGGLIVEDLEAETWAMLVGIAALVLSWPVYDALWKSPLGRDERVGAVVSFALIVVAAYALNHFMGPRAMYIHVGSMLGTLMAANVWMVIIPAQRQMVAALAEGKEPDQALAARAKGRSKHNTFMVVPVVFLMISNHFPTITYGTEMNWLVLAVMVLV
ncbi:MAG TPA: urate hydroxylase PuuD [Bacteroidota bacterium]|nr:urate hydroxylase PuuD [Bacteroidota bacterium]